MRKKLKTFFGQVGLVAVVAMTIFAYSLPSPEASAMNATGNINITLQVVGPEITTTRIASPCDSCVVTESPLNLVVDYTYADSYKITITNVKTGQELEFSDSLSPTQYGTITKSNIDLDKIGGFGDYIITVHVEREENGNFADDSIRFSYQPSAPDVPNTGNISATLNITRTDYLISGLIIFLAISFGLLVFIRKDHRK